MNKKSKARPVETPAVAPAPAEVALAPAFRMRLGAGKYAIAASEVEVHLDGARIAGGNGSFEFDLHAEAWVDIKLPRV